MNIHNPTVSEAADSTSMASFNHMASGLNVFDNPGDTASVAYLQAVAEEKPQENDAGSVQ